MSTFLFIIAIILILLAFSGVISSIKNNDSFSILISFVFLCLSFIPAYFGYMQMELTGIVEAAVITNERTDEFRTIRCEFTVWVRNKDGDQDKIVWWGTKNDSRFSSAEAAVDPDIDNQSHDSKKFEYKRCEIQ